MSTCLQVKDRKYFAVLGYMIGYSDLAFFNRTRGGGGGNSREVALVGTAVCSSLALGYLLGKFRGSRRYADDYIQKPSRDCKQTLSPPQRLPLGIPIKISIIEKILDVTRNATHDETRQERCER